MGVASPQYYYSSALLVNFLNQTGEINTRFAHLDVKSKAKRREEIFLRI